MYLSCIQAIMQVKTAALAWNSPMLNDITAVKTWTKVNEGLIKMYRVEVMGKLPIMQHFLFGRLINFEPSSDNAEAGPASNVPLATPMHVHSMRGDCCGNPIPSVYAAAQDDKATNQRNLRNLPYD
jgi:serine/threonine-protein phosphatase 2A activator